MKIRCSCKRVVDAVGETATILNDLIETEFVMAMKILEEWSEVMEELEFQWK
jgi:hypothetical protein